MGETIVYAEPATPTTRAARAKTRKENRRLSRSVSEAEEADLVAQEEEMDEDEEEEQQGSDDDNEVKEDDKLVLADPVRRMAMNGFTSTFASIFKDDTAIAAASASLAGGNGSGLIDLDPEAFGRAVEKELFDAFSVRNNIGNMECAPKVSNSF